MNSRIPSLPLSKTKTMGCGESKHAVATENTITKSKSRSNNAEKTPPVNEDTKFGGDVNVNEVKNPGDGKVKENEIPGAIKREETAEEGKGESEKTDGKEKENDGHGNGESGVGGKVEEREGKLGAAAVVVVEENKGESKNEGLKGGKEELKVKKEVEFVQEEQGKLVSHDSPNHNFSHKKDHGETIESITTEGISGKGMNGEANSNKQKGLSTSNSKRILRLRY